MGDPKLVQANNNVKYLYLFLTLTLDKKRQNNNTSDSLIGTQLADIHGTTSKSVILRVKPLRLDLSSFNGNSTFRKVVFLKVDLSSVTLCDLLRFIDLLDSGLYNLPLMCISLFFFLPFAVRLTFTGILPLTIIIKNVHYQFFIFNQNLCKVI